MGCAFALPQTVEQVGAVKHLYVEPFTVKNGSSELRSYMVAELRHMGFVAIVPERSAADAVLSGNGEIWIKGYRSLNPRSGRSPSNGTPVYTGFLSVEVKDLKGETLWSYLVTPGSGSENISKDLSKRIAKHLADAYLKKE
jgi:hypothetical protein